MDENETLWIGKRIFCILKTKQIYQGDVIKETPETILVRDKFSQLVQISKTDIKFLKQEELDEKRKTTGKVKRSS
jgi:RNase P/RNase MRP subunit p29